MGRATEPGRVAPVGPKAREWTAAENRLPAGHGRQRLMKVEVHIVRLFIAIELPKDVRDYLGGLSREWQGTWNQQRPLGFTPEEHPRPTWVAAAIFHVTVKFFGEVPEPDVTTVCGALAQTVGAGVMRLQPDRIECFPPSGPVRTITAGLGGDVGRLQRLHREIDERCAAIGYSPEPREYRPHITLARAKSPLPRYMRNRLVEMSAARLPGPGFEATEFVLMESRLRPAGPEYILMARFHIDTSSRKLDVDE